MGVYVADLRRNSVAAFDNTASLYPWTVMHIFCLRMYYILQSTEGRRSLRIIKVFHTI